MGSMITDKDFKKLHTIFATKQELQDVKSELKSEIIALRVTLKKELREEMTKFTSQILHAIHTMHEELKTTNERLDKHDREISNHHVAIKSLNQRVQTLEFAPFK